MRAYSADLRQRVLADCDAGEGTRAVARRYRVSESWVRAVKQRRRETGEVAARPAGGRRFAKVDRGRLAELVARAPDATLAELRDRLGLRCSPSAVHQALRALRITLKKR